MYDVLTELNQIGADTEKAVACFMNDENMYLKYVRKFPDEPTMGRLMKAVEDRDLTAAEQAVHALKGIVGNLRFVPLADAAVTMLGKLRDGDADAALVSYKEVRKQYKQYCDVILGWRS